MQRLAYVVHLHSAHVVLMLSFVELRWSLMVPPRANGVQVSSDSLEGRKGVRSENHAGFQAVRVRFRHLEGAGAKLRVRRERMELREEQSKVSSWHCRHQLGLCNSHG